MSRDPLMRHAESHFDFHNFDELFEFAAATCLRETPEVTTPINDSPEAELIRKVGTRGLGVALSIINRPNAFTFTKTEDEKNAYVTTSLPIREATTDIAPASPEIQAKIMSFGQQLLAEAYVSLGTDVKQKITAFKEAKTDAEQIAILEWLDNRIYALQRRAQKGQSEDEIENEKFYHPIRLSPKIMGQYPHNQTDPTCLAVSVLASSFLEQTGADHVHAGAMATYQQDDSLVFADMCERLADRTDLPLSDMTRERLYARADDIVAKSSSDAFHAASLVKLQSGAWFVLDPNYNRSYVLPEDDSKTITKAYDQLKEFQDIAPGTEQHVKLGMIGPLHIATTAMYEIKLDAASDDEVAGLLTPISLETFQASIRQYVFDALRNSSHHYDQLQTFYDRFVMANMGAGMYLDHGRRENTVFNEGFETAWEAFFLNGTSPQEIIDRSATDPYYAQRRIEDLRALPYLTLVTAMKAFIAVDWETPHEYSLHESLEVGLPAYRIGAAVLSDFASHCGSELSYSFWTNHWPSHIPITEHAEAAESRPHELPLVANHTNWLRQYSLIYHVQNGIIA